MHCSRVDALSPDVQKPPQWVDIVLVAMEKVGREKEGGKMQPIDGTESGGISLKYLTGYLQDSFSPSDWPER